MREQRPEIRRTRDLLTSRRQRLSRHHAHTPSLVQCTGSTVAPASCAAAIAGRGSSRVMKNIAPPAPDPAALPPSAPACARSEEHTSELQSRLHLVCRLL